MREIKFRARATTDGPRHKKGDWLYGFYCQMIGPVKRIHFIYSGLVDSGKPGFLERNRIDIKTLGQETGLKDKNGKEIYEGDILRQPANCEWQEKNFMAYEVFYHDNDCADKHVGFQMNRTHCYGCVCGGEIYGSFLPKFTEKMEVIGDIHENPELLEK